MRRIYAPPTGMASKELDKFYSKKMVQWDQNYSYVNVPIACLAGIFYGAYSDRYGRKLPVLLSLLSLLVDNAIYMLVWWEETDLALYWIYAAAALNGLFGSFSLLMTAIQAYVTDQFEEKRTMSLRMVLVSATYSTGTFAGGLLTGQLIKIASNMVVMLVIEGLILAALLFSITMLDNIQPKSEAKSEGDESGKRGLAPWRIFANGVLSLRDSATIFFRKREGYFRMFLVAGLLADFVDQMVFNEEKGRVSF